MEAANHLGTIVRFENFELDLCTHELYRDGSRQKIRGHPVDVLAVLLEHPGELVTRETLRKRLWPNDTFVDFEQILNNSVGKLRDALGDNAESPRFIETLPRLGYRLIVPAQNRAPLPQGPRLTLVEPDDHLQTESADQTAQITPGRLTGIRNLAAMAFLLLLAISATIFVAHRWLSRTAPVVHRIAVLPLVNISVDSQEEYFADGMTERLITELAQFNAWEVISRTSVMRYKSSNKSLPEIAHELSADWIIEGTVQRAGSQVRITAQLIDAQRDVHLWSGSFERNMIDVLALQREIAFAVAERTNIALSSQDTARLQSPHKVVAAAYDAFLTGKYLFELRKFKEASDYFERATIADPNFALAYSYLAEADGMWNSALETPRSERAIKAARRAMELDPNLAESHINRGDWRFFAQWDWAGGEAEFRRAIELDPHSESAALHYALCLDALKRWDESIAVYKKALRVDPFSRLLQVNLLAVLVHARRHEEAIAQFNEAIRIAPDAADAYQQIGGMYADMKHDKEAVEAYLKADQLSGQPTDRLRSFRRAYEDGGLHGYWRMRLEMRQKEINGGRVPPYAFAVLSVRAGENDRAMEYLEEAYKQRQPMMAWINSIIVFDPLKNDPRYKDLLRRMNFPSPVR